MRGHLDHAEGGRLLEAVAEKIPADQLVELFAGDGVERLFGDRFALAVERVRRAAEADDAGIGAVAPHEVGREARGVAHEQDKQAGGIGVERAAVTHLDEVEALLDGLHHVVGRDVGRLVDEQDAVEFGQTRD